MMKNKTLLYSLSILTTCLFATTLSAQSDDGDGNDYELFERNTNRADFNPYDYPSNIRDSSGPQPGRRYHIDYMRSQGYNPYDGEQGQSDHRSRPSRGQQQSCPHCQRR